MQNLILWVRHLRDVPSFRVSVQVIVFLLMILGGWVATNATDFSDVFDLNDKLKHFIVFFGFAFLMDLAVSRHPFWLWKGFPLLAYGAVIEVMQYFSPDRSFSVLDWVADLSGILLYFMLKLIILWVSSIKLINERY